MLKRNILNFVLTGLLLCVGSIYLLKNDFNHSGPKENIWNKISNIENPPIVEPGQIITYEEFLATAKKTDRKILIVFGADWCTWCKKLDKETIKNQEVIKSIAENNTISINVDVDQRKDLAKKFSIHGIPAYVIVDKDEKIIRQGSGFKDPQNFINWMTGKWGTEQKFFLWLFGN